MTGKPPDADNAAGLWRPSAGLAGRDQNHAHPRLLSEHPAPLRGPDSGPSWELSPQPTPASPRNEAAPRGPPGRGVEAPTRAHCPPPQRGDRLRLHAHPPQPSGNSPGRLSAQNSSRGAGGFTRAPLQGAPGFALLGLSSLLAAFLCQLSSLMEASGGGRAVVNKCLAVNQELDRSRRGPA